MLPCISGVLLQRCERLLYITPGMGVGAKGFGGHRGTFKRSFRSGM